MLNDPWDSIEDGICDLEREVGVTRAHLRRLTDRPTGGAIGLTVGVICALLIVWFASATAAPSRPRAVFTVLGSSGTPIMSVDDTGQGGSLAVTTQRSFQGKKKSPFVVLIAADDRGNGTFGVTNVNGKGLVAAYYPPGKKAGSFDIVGHGVTVAQLGPDAKVMALRISNVTNKKVAQFGESTIRTGTLFMFSAEGQLRIQAYSLDDIGYVEAMGPNGTVPLWFRGWLVGK